MMTTKETGDFGESIACTFLQRKGFAILGRNYRKVWGEIDIIAEKGNIVRFVEVKSVTRENISAGAGDYRPEEQVHPKKLERICRTAETYMLEKKDSREFQVDVVGVLLDPVRKQAHCRLYENVL